MKGLLEGKDKIQHDYKEKAEMKSCNKIEKIEENAGSREKNLKSSEEKYRVEGLRLKIGRLDLRQLRLEWASNERMDRCNENKRSISLDEEPETIWC